MTKIEEVYVDMDGVLCDFVGDVCKFHNVSNPYFNTDNIGEYSLNKILGKKYMDIFGPLDAQFWANLPKLPWCDDLMKKVSRKYEVHILTAPSGNKKCYEGKALWIEKHYPHLLDKLLIGRPKYCCAKSHSLLIDDKESNIDAFNEAGGLGLLVPQPWNRLYYEHTWQYIEKCLDNL